MSCDPTGHGLHKNSKPNLRGYNLRAFHHLVYGACVVGTITCILYRVLYYNPMKRDYREFYKNVDQNKEEERMTALGLFQSGPNRRGKNESEGSNESTEQVPETDEM